MQDLSWRPLRERAVTKNPKRAKIIFMLKIVIVEMLSLNWTFGEQSSPFIGTSYRGACAGLQRKGVSRTFHQLFSKVSILQSISLAQSVTKSSNDSPSAIKFSQSKLLRTLSSHLFRLLLIVTGKLSNSHLHTNSFYLYLCSMVECTVSLRPTINKVEG